MSWGQLVPRVDPLVEENPIARHYKRRARSQARAERIQKARCGAWKQGWGVQLDEHMQQLPMQHRSRG